MQKKKSFRTFLWVWITQSLSTLGSTVSFFALTIWLTQSLYPTANDKSHLAMALTGMTISFFLPGILVTLIAGVWVDRVNRKNLMIVTNTLNGLISGGLTVLIMTGRSNLGVLFVLMALSGILEAFHTSAFQASYIMIVPDKHLSRANGMMQTTASLSNVLGPGLAAVLISLASILHIKHSYGVAMCIALDGATFFVAAASLFFLTIPSPHREQPRKKQNVWRDAVEGFHFLWTHKPMLWLMGTFTVGNFALPFAFVLQPLLIKYNYGADWTRHGFTYTAALALLSMVGNIGGVAGGVLMSTWGGLKRHRPYGVFLPAIFTGLGICMFGLTQSYYVALGCNFVILATMPITVSHFQTMLQENTPSHLQGRIFSIRRLLGSGLFPVGTACAGALSTVTSLSLLLVIVGALFAAFNLVQFINPLFIPKNSGVASDWESNSL